MFHKPFFKPIFLLGLLSLLARAWISAARRNPKRYPLAPWKWLPAMIYRYVLWRCCRVSGIWAFPASGVSCLRWRNMGLTRAQCLDGRRPRLSLNRRGRPRRGRYCDWRPTGRRRHRRFMLSRCRRRFADTQRGWPRDGGSVATVAINRGDTDMLPVLTQIGAGAPNGLFFPIFPDEGAQIIGQNDQIAGLEGVTLIGGSARPCWSPISSHFRSRKAFTSQARNRISPATTMRRPARAAKTSSATIARSMARRQHPLRG